MSRKDKLWCPIHIIDGMPVFTGGHLRMRYEIWRETKKGFVRGKCGIFDGPLKIPKKSCITITTEVLS